MSTPKSRPQLVGLSGEDLTGPECQVLRAAVGLERRHIVTLCNALRLADIEATMDRVTTWEKSKGRGYPRALAATLLSFEEAVHALALTMADEALIGGRSEAGGSVTVRRPLGRRRIHQLMAARGLSWRPDELSAIESHAADIWGAMADVAAARAAMALGRDGWPVRVVLDREPDPTT